MNYFQFIEELIKRGFQLLNRETFSIDYAYKNIIVSMSGGWIDEYGYLYPYRLVLNDSRNVIGHKRCLKYIDNLLSGVEVGS